MKSAIQEVINMASKSDIQTQLSEEITLHFV